MRILLTLLGCTLFLSAQDTNSVSFQLRNGDRISGQLISDNDTVIVIRTTSIGDVKVLRSALKPQTITVYLKDGSIVSGDVLRRDGRHIDLMTAFGPVEILLTQIDRTTEAGVTVPGTAASEEFYYSRERLTDVFFDPTGFTLEKGSVYFSGLSWGVALSEDVEISSSYWRYAFTDLNVRPNFRIYSRGNLESEDAASIGFHFHSAGPTGKQRHVHETVTQFDTYQNRNVSWTTDDWVNVGSENDYTLWTELFASYTHSVLKQNRLGRLSFHTGASVILHHDAVMPRAWVAVENDVTDRFKLIGQVYYDRFQPSYREMVQRTSTNNPFNLDFGFVYAISESFRVGIHYQPYIILLYFKF